MSTYLIYGLVDPRNQQLRYVGMSRRGLRRPREHIKERFLKKNTYKNNWIRQLLGLGLRPRIVVIQEFQDPDILSQAEIFWIAYFKRMGCPLTNHCRGGEGFTGRHSVETKEKIRIASTGRLHSMETRRAMSTSKTGRPLSLEHRLALRVPHKPLSQETRLKMSLSRTGKPMNAKSREIFNARNAGLRKPVVDSLGRVYESQSSAARILGLEQANVLKVLKGRLKTTGGLSFSYVGANDA